MEKKLSNNCQSFSGDPHVTFFQAVERGKQICSGHSTWNFSVVFDSVSGDVELFINQEQHQRDYVPLFGPGDVPGYLSEEDMHAISELVKKLPNSGTIVEIGSFLGKSAVEWAKNIEQEKKDYKIICIDRFNSEVNVLNDVLKAAEFDVPTANSHFEMFKYYTKKYPSIQPLESFFNQDFVFNHKVDLVFEDSDHSQETLSYALPFWWERINVNGILSGHDYCLKQVKTSVDLFAIINNLQVKQFKNSSIWYIEKHA